MDRFQTGSATATLAERTSGSSDHDEIEPVPPARNPFSTPVGYNSPYGFGSARGSSTGFQQAQPPTYFHSRRIKKGELERPWLGKKDPKEKWVTIIPLIGIFVGLALSGFLIYEGLQGVTNHVYCPVLDEDFSGADLNSKVWTREVEVGGYGNGQFEETTNTNENSYVKDGMLYIKPTLQDESLINNNNVLNLLQDGSCTATDWYACVAVTNTTNGTIINPVKSARLNTKVGASIKYGRVEVVAQLPAGDWMWPAIWMLPVNNTYGDWPASGEIDIMEARGNNYTYPQGGNNIVSSTLHWGPDADNDAWWQNNVKREALHTTYSSGFHTFGLEWSEKYIFSYIDTRLLQVLYTNFNKPFWQKGKFPVSDTNGTRLVDPWSQTGHDSTPFDQDFYLILNVAVGSTNGWFDDGVASKPWVDASPSAKHDFWNARNQWYPTWQKSGEMIIKSVKMWQQKGYNGCTG
ncbi:glycoside hydrolase family 16 protein [Baudoinia panamericana UAMH 10762]|uniref:Glycoside hydrolase family 16 protein n=1 Tax=Baudoinia panamericana (strain UAMH 10762) TaxID=717646 RepID=M2N729_BAUPA|nr:glycoside hydrolase family 16 protein [Baudoinia panamericana UAMH 10762]EMC94585.1 glycoside hydrolase family 16 protein [Baudoinia panamericana UAMH 10762]